MKKIIFYCFILSFTLIFACGKSIVSVTNESYEPKIVVQGYLTANLPIQDIIITRNFPVGSNLEKMNIFPDVNTTSVTVENLTDQKIYTLSFKTSENGKTNEGSWCCLDPGVRVEYGKTYRLNVSATVEGTKLNTSSTTTVPNEGLAIVSVNYDKLTYRQKDYNDHVMNFTVTFDRSPETDFYLYGIMAVDAHPDSFIYDNPVLDYDREDVVKDLEDLKYTHDWNQNLDPDFDKITTYLDWFSFWFYGNYQITVYAVDKNYARFLQTYNDVQEMDGNFHEARFCFEGDGIGVFGSVVADTVSVKIVH